jgi:hypothetical protein
VLTRAGAIEWWPSKFLRRDTHPNHITVNVGADMENLLLTVSALRQFHAICAPKKRDQQIAFSFFEPAVETNTIQRATW